MSQASGTSKSSESDLELAGFIGMGLTVFGSVAYGIGVLFWFAGQVSALLTGGGWPDASPNDVVFSAGVVFDHPGDPALAWPAAARAAIGPVVLVYVLFALALVPLGYLMYLVVRFALNWRRRREFRRLRLGFASGWEVRRM